MKQAEDPVCFTERQNKRTVIKTVDSLTLQFCCFFCKKIHLIIMHELKYSYNYLNLVDLGKN